MKKIIASFSGLLAVLILVPLVASAQVISINGLTAGAQSMVSPGSNASNTMHMDIITVGTDTHRFRWDGSPWRVDQGGTGLQTAPQLSEMLVGDGLGGYTLTSVSSLGFVPYTGATADVDLGDFNFAAASLTLPSGDLIFGGQSLNLIDSTTGHEMNIILPSPNAITFSGDNVGTTTVAFGLIGQGTSHSCFNTKNTDGQDISFYFVGTTMVVENNLCQ